jgi:hypothetical protein
MGIEDLLAHPLLWRGGNGGSAGTAAIATGFAALDRYLPGGGWPLAGITEIFIERYGLGELRILMPALAALSCRAAAARRWIVWIAPPFVPYAPALAQHGVDLSRILLVHPSKKKGSDPFFAEPRSGDTLWAVEQAIRSQSSVAVLAWVGEADVPVLRRLQLGAEASRCWTVLFRPAAAMRQSSPAALRFSLTAAASGMAADGLAGIQVEIQKCRGRRPQRLLL